jgi:hypothetical protein
MTAVSEAACKTTCTITAIQVAFCSQSWQHGTSSALANELNTRNIITSCSKHKAIFSCALIPFRRCFQSVHFAHYGSEWQGRCHHANHQRRDWVLLPVAIQTSHGAEIVSKTKFAQGNDNSLWEMSGPGWWHRCDNRAPPTPLLSISHSDRWWQQDQAHWGASVSLPSIAIILITVVAVFYLLKTSLSLCIGMIVETKLEASLMLLGQ